MAIYYRFSGLVACAALLTNLVLIMALMVLLNAPLTLPGLAGLVLTIGMSVDANVLIFERIREEMARGAALRMAIRNGFARATTTIVDANVTTLITAMVLYAIGTDQIRGFAVTLIFGILMSMYTAIFCSRVVFDIAERRRWITRAEDDEDAGATQLDFIGKRQVAIAISIVLILVGLDCRGDPRSRVFLISTSTVACPSRWCSRNRSRPMTSGRRLNDYFEAEELPEAARSIPLVCRTVIENTVYKIDIEMQDKDIPWFENAIEEIFRDSGGNSELATYSMAFGELTEEQVKAAALPGSCAQTLGRCRDTWPDAPTK